MTPMLVDAEAMAIEFLATRLDVPVSTKVRNPRPSEFVRVVRTGGTAGNRILDFPRLTVTAEADTSIRAAELAQMARTALLNDYTAMPLVRGASESGGLYYNPDPDTNRDRYTFTVTLNVRAKN